MIRIGLLGASGRMGLRVKETVKNEMSSLCKIDVVASLGDSVEPLLDSDVVIDFSSVGAVTGLCTAGLRLSRTPPLVSGSTGWTTEQRRILVSYSEKAPVISGSNFSDGVLAVIRALEELSRMLGPLGYKGEILEVHHQHKKDSPSGTALTLQEVMNQSGIPGDQIPIRSSRTGEVIGNHEVVFQGPSDRIRLVHEAENRDIFARGAVRAALWLQGEFAAKRLLSGLLSTHDYMERRWRNQ